MGSFVRKGGVWVVLQGLFFVAFPFALMAQSDMPTALRALGVALGVSGLGLVGGGMRALGRRATPFPEPVHGARLVIDGVFAMVRHPIYGGIGLFAIGLGLAWPSSRAVFLAAAMLFFFRLKAAREEERLLAVYPEYARYRNDVRAVLIPFLL